jgi:hypothetical protein
MGRNMVGVVFLHFAFNFRIRKFRPDQNSDRTIQVSAIPLSYKALVEFPGVQRKAFEGASA